MYYVTLEDGKQKQVQLKKEIVRQSSTIVAKLIVLCNDI